MPAVPSTQTHRWLLENIQRDSMLSFGALIPNLNSLDIYPTRLLSKLIERLLTKEGADVTMIADGLEACTRMVRF